MPPRFITEPDIETKIRKMRQRVRWQHSQISDRNIDQTRLVLEDGGTEDEAFSFLVLGDSGTGRHRTSSPQRQVAKRLLAQDDSPRFTIHTGDVVYLVGSKQQYRSNFIRPYREWLVGGDSYRHIHYDRMVFQRPFLPVLGNHDYYDLPLWLGVLAGITTPLRYLLRSFIDLDISWHGSFQGDAYAKAFLDYLRAIPEAQLGEHLDTYYPKSAGSDSRALVYRPGQFTRLPNRYYTFRYGGIDFFALDSNTFNQPLPLAVTEVGYQELQQQRERLEAKKADLMRQSGLNAFSPASEEREDLTEKMEAIDEQLYDIEKQLNSDSSPTVDTDQLAWLRDRLIASWQDPSVRGRILFFHHPPYVSEDTKWAQGQTLAVRYQLRQVLDAVLSEVQAQAQGRPMVDLVLNGHAHCFEYLRTEDTGHGDAHIPWVICGGSGYSLRRQRPEGPTIAESRDGTTLNVAKSHLYLGRSGHGSRLKRPYSGLRVEISQGTPPQITVIPLVAEKYKGDWQEYEMEGFVV